mmetsp:Transcript_41543/g.109629  ORF Transcript_41543/g.109629 Transcript_41543/m.109629 type:complete len:343 (-) Transcript_41543:15-1043(-)
MFPGLAVGAAAMSSLRNGIASHTRQPSVPYSAASRIETDEEKQKTAGGDCGASCYSCVRLSLAFVIGGLLATGMFYWHYSPLLASRNSRLRSQLDSEMATADQANQYLMHRNAAMVKQMGELAASTESVRAELGEVGQARATAETKERRVVHEEEMWHNKFEEEEAELEALNAQDREYKRSEQALINEKHALLDDREKSDQELSLLFHVEELVKVGNVTSLKQHVEALLQEGDDLRRQRQELADAGVTKEHVQNLTSAGLALRRQVDTVRNLNSELLQEERRSESREQALREQVKGAATNNSKLEEQVGSLRSQVAMLIEQNNFLQRSTNASQTSVIQPGLA